MFILERHVAVPRAKLENLRLQLHRLGDMVGNMILEAETPRHTGHTAPLEVPSGHRAAK